MRLRSTLVGILFLCTMITSCSRREAPADAATRNHTLLLGNLSEPADLDPHIVTAYTDQNVTLALFEGLTAIDEKTSLPVPAVAERWDVSPDGLTYTFFLRMGARWSNGEPVTARDFAYSVQRILSPGLASEYSYMLWSIKNAEGFTTGRIKTFSEVGVRAVDDRTFEVTLERPTPYLLSLAAHPTWFPVHRPTIEKFGRMDQRSTAWTRPGNLVGNGAFVLQQWSPNSRIVVEKNPQYWDAVNNGLERVIFFPTENADSEERAYRAGQMHITYSLPIEKIATYNERSPGQLRRDAFLQTYFLRFNVTKPPLDNPKVRRALSLALDRESLAKNVLRGSRLPAPYFTPPDCAGYTAEARVPTDFAAARALLAEAGFPRGEGLPVFEVQVRNDDTQSKVTEAIQAMWQHELGIRISIAPFEQKIWLQNQQSLNYTIAFSGWVGDFADPATFLELFTKDAGNNWTGWSNADYDGFLQSAATATSSRDRLQHFQQAEALLLEQGPIAPLYFGARVYAIKPAVKNWQPSLLGFHRYQLIRLGR
ncbi:MAG: peptide ABC transporter substrate-binding protein [Opitutus sp.]